MKISALPLTWLCAVALALSVTSSQAQLDPALQEQGVLYFDGNLPTSLTAKVGATTTVYLHRDFQMALAAVYTGQPLEIIGMSPEGYMVKTTYRNNTVTGWIRPQDLPPSIDPSVFALARKNQTHRDAIAVAIANKTVVQGMTPDEVKQAVGRPLQVTSRVDPTGSLQTWTYTTYREDPQYEYTMDGFGRPVLQTYYVKVPIGQLVVAFANNAVVAVEQHKTDPSSAGVVTN